MSNRVLDLENFQNNQPSTGLAIDFKRVAFQALRYWYFILLSLILFVGSAYLRNRYATRIYPVKASIIIKETEETGGAELLYKNSLIDPYRNYLNELYIIKSYPLIQQVIEDLNFEVSFFKEGNFLTTETYGGLSFSAKVRNSFGQTSKKFHFVILDEKRFQLFANGDGNSENKIRTTFNFGDSIVYEGLELLFVVAEDKKPIPGESYIFLYQTPSSLAGGYVGKLSAEWAEEGAGVINLSVNGANPAKDIDFLKGLIKRYQQYDLDKKNQTASRTIEFIGQQLADISDSLQRVEMIMEKFKDKTFVTNTGEETTRLYEKLEALDLQQTDFLIHKNYYEYLISYIRESSNPDMIIAPSSVGINDPVLSSLIGKMVDIQLELKMVSGNDKHENPLVSERAKRLAEIRKSIIEAVKNIRATESIKNDYLLKQIAVTEKQLSSLPSSERKFISIKRNYSLLENLYVFLLQKKSEAGISKASSSTDILVVNPPMLSGGAILPKTSQNYTLAIFLGLLLPALSFILIEVFNTKVQSKEDIEKIVRIPFIGGIGHKKADESLVVLNSPKSVVAESFRALRTNLNYFLTGVQKPVVIVSSSISGEGKTFTTINLASVIAMSGKRTLIVGADMRRPRLYTDFKLDNSIGLSSYLAGLTSFEEIIQKTQQENLFLISGGPVPPNPSELLLGDQLKLFLEKARAAFDFVIIDTPPMAIVTDAIGLSEYADHTIFVIRQNYTPKQLLQSIKEYHESRRLEKISILLNDIYKSGPGYGYGYGYAYGYGYSSKKNGYGYYSES